MKREIRRLRLKVSLKGSEPLIWRRIEINSNIILDNLQFALSMVMPWNDTEPYKFIDKNNKCYGPNSFISKKPVNQFDYRKDLYYRVFVGDVLFEKDDKIDYIYDFEDKWHHEIVVEEVFPHSIFLPRVQYIDGCNHCPPDSCGGLKGYYKMLKIVNDPQHIEYQRMMTWIHTRESYKDIGRANAFKMENREYYPDYEDKLKRKCIKFEEPFDPQSTHIDKDRVNHILFEVRPSIFTVVKKK